MMLILVEIAASNIFCRHDNYVILFKGFYFQSFLLTISGITRTMSKNGMKRFVKTSTYLK